MTAEAARPPGAKKTRRGRVTPCPTFSILAILALVRNCSNSAWRPIQTIVDWPAGAGPAGAG